MTWHRWDPRVGKENRDTAGPNCVLGMKIFILRLQLSVRNMVPTITSSKRRGLSLDGRC
jgi:hypothetical protein